MRRCVTERREVVEQTFVVWQSNVSYTGFPRYVLHLGAVSTSLGKRRIACCVQVSFEIRNECLHISLGKYISTCRNSTARQINRNLRVWYVRWNLLYSPPSFRFLLNCYDHDCVSFSISSNGHTLWISVTENVVSSSWIELSFDMNANLTIVATFSRMYWWDRTTPALCASCRVCNPVATRDDGLVRPNPI